MNKAQKAFEYNKAVVAGAMAVISPWLIRDVFQLEMPGAVETILVGFSTALVVWLVPNLKRAVEGAVDRIAEQTPPFPDE